MDSQLETNGFFFRSMNQMHISWVFLWLFSLFRELAKYPPPLTVFMFPKFMHSNSFFAAFSD